MTIFLTGSTGYIGSYLASGFLRHSKERLALLVRARSQQEAYERLWKSLQLHFEFPEFYDFLKSRVDVYLGDLTEPELGLSKDHWSKLVHSLDSVVHCAASLNRKSEKACFNVNLRGTLSVLRLAKDAHVHHGLRRFSEVSTVAVAGTRSHETVREDLSVDWNRSDYDPYGRTKKFCEHMLHELLPDVSTLVFRPSTVLGDSRFPQITQFDMVWAFVFLSQMPLIPLSGKWRMDIVPVDYVSEAIVTLHQKDHPQHSIYHLSSGESSPTFEAIRNTLKESGFGLPYLFFPPLRFPFDWTVRALMHTPRSWGLSKSASMIKVFLPYLNYDTVFDNSRVAAELGFPPKRFVDYAYPLFRFAKDSNFRYPYQPWPTSLPIVAPKEAHVAL